jgi:tRNA dimethylallyltransferase
VGGLLERGVPAEAPSMSSLGYPEIVAYLQGRLALEEAIEQIQHHTHRYARHQLTWLRRMRDVHWFDPRDPGWYAAMLELARRFLDDKTTSSTPT